MAAELVGLEFLKKNEIKNKSCDPTRPYAFISYSHDPHDAQIVMNVFNVLYNKGYNLWIDTANMPHDENAWSDCAIGALRNKRCTFAFFFRSESSMSKETIAKELETIKRLRHVQRIVTVDIWHDERNTANLYYDELLNGDDTADGTAKFKACERICNIVSMDNSAIRLAADVQNNILRLAEFMEEELRELGVLPPKHNGGLETTLIEKVEPEPQVIELTTSVELTAAKKQETSPSATKTPVSTGEDMEPPEVPGGMQTITLPDFLKQYNLKTFGKNTFQEFRLVGQGEYAKYNSAFCDSASPLVWAFVENRLKEQGAPYIQFVNERNDKSKNPPFITVEEQQRRKAAGNNMAYRRLEVSGLECWAMCINYSQYAWINDVLRKRMQELGLPLEKFSLEYVPGGEKESQTSTTGITKPVDLGGNSANQRKRAVEEDGYNITLYGERYTGLSLKDMMLTVFKETLDRRPDKRDLLLENLRCLGRGNLIRRDARPTVFRAGDTHIVDGVEISIGTSLGQGPVLSYISRLMSLCGEPKENLVIDGYDY